MRQDKVRNVLKGLLESFRTGNVPEAIAVSVLPKPPDVPSSRWSLSNRLILLFSGTSDARGFRQWKEVGRHPKKGSKAIYIFSPRYKKVEKEKDEEKLALIGFLAVPVFRYEDTEGKPLDVPDFQPLKLPPLHEVAESWKIRIRYVGSQGGVYGTYSPQAKRITLATHDESVFFHELAHAAHERVKGKLRGGQDWKQEVVAELTAAVLAHLCGKKTNDGGAYRYIEQYAEKAGKDVYKACLAVIAGVEKCLDLILAERDEAPDSESAEMPAAEAVAVQGCS